MRIYIITSLATLLIICVLTKHAIDNQWHRQWIAKYYVEDAQLFVEKELHEDLSSYPTVVQEVIQKVKKIKSICGDVCDTTITGPYNEDTGLYSIKKKFDCQKIFQNAPLHDQFDSQPHGVIPIPLLKDFTYNGRIQIHNWFFNLDFNSPKHVYTWERGLVDELVQRARQGNLDVGGYSLYDNGNVMDGLKRMNLKGARVLAIGSISPWLESLILANDASHVVTLEYSTIKTDHPNLSSMLPEQYIAAYMEGTLQPFDAMVTFSSLEHAGLGRYGDGLHPWGDLVAMSRVWCVTKPGAQILFAAEGSQTDSMAWNGHRCYGPLMFSHALANFKLLWSSHPRLENTSKPGCLNPFVQPVMVAQRIP